MCYNLLQFEIIPFLKPDINGHQKFSQNKHQVKMDKKDQEKSKAFWLKVIKSGQEEATSSPTSGSSFTGAAAGGAWSSSGAAGGGAWASSERPVAPAWPSRTPYKSVPQKSGSESWKSTSTTGAGGGGAWSSTKTGGAWSSSGAAGGGAWASSERPVAPAWPSRTPYKSVPQKSGSESWKSTSTAGAGSGGAWSSTKTGGAWSSSGAVGGGAWSSTKTGEAWSSTKTAGAWSSSGALGGGSWASSERPVAPAWPSRTPYKSVPQKSGSESWKSTSTAGAGGGGAWSSTKTGGAWSSSGAVGGGAWSSTKTGEAWSSTKTAGAWSSSGALGGGSWASSERPVAPAWPSRTPYKSVPQRSEPESWKPTKSNEQTSHRVTFDLSSQSTSKSKPPPYRHVEPSPTPEVRQVTAFPSVWSPSTARKVTKKN